MFLLTSNVRKLAEFRRFGLDIDSRPGADLPEIKGTPEQVAIYKALAAGPDVVVEDTTLQVSGTDIVDIRWRIQDLTAGSPAAWIVYLAHNAGSAIHLYRGTTHGTIIKPETVPVDAFGFDPYFVPDGQSKSLYEQEKAGTKDHFSARLLAVQDLLSGRSLNTVNVADLPAWSGGYQNKP